MKERIDFEREFDPSIYEAGYFTGNGSSAYEGYENAKGIVEEQYQAIHNAMINIPHKQSVLDLGCAYGYGTRLLHNQSWQPAVGVDISEHAVEKARALHCTPDNTDTLRFSQGNILDAATYESYEDNQFGLIVGTELLEHVPSSDVHGALQQMKRVADWGFFVINARTIARVEAEQQVEDTKNDHGHLNFNSMTWWIKEFSRHGDIDYDLMTRFSVATIGKHGVNWHSRCIVVKFNDDAK